MNFWNLFHKLKQNNCKGEQNNEFKRTVKS